MAMAPSFDVGGWFANAPGIFQRVGSVLLRGPAISAPVKHLVLARDAFAQSDAEVADLWFHTLVLLGARGIPLREVLAELASRHVARGSPSS